MMMKKPLVTILFLLEIYTISCKTCLQGWTDVLDLGCLHFGSEPSSWFGASSYCEEIHPNSSMIEILSQDENDLVSLVGNFIFPMTGLDGWWIGLDDIGHEGLWQWQPSVTIASYFSWAYSKPSSKPVNRNDCVYMFPNSSANIFVWTDFYCDYQDNDIKIAPLCQIKDGSTSTTTEAPSPTSSTTTTEMPTSSTTTTEVPTTTSPRLCPESYDQWEWSHFNGNCYKFVNSSVRFNDAQSYCSNVDNNGDLASIHSREENDFIGKLIKNSGTASEYIWIGGSVASYEDLCNENDDKWTWSDGTPWNYNNWYPGEPTCGGSSHYPYLCATIGSDSDLGNPWYNIDCTSSYQEKLEFVCETLSTTSG